MVGAVLLTPYFVNAGGGGGGSSSGSSRSSSPASATISNPHSVAGGGTRGTVTSCGGGCHGLTSSQRSQMNSPGGLGATYSPTRSARAGYSVYVADSNRASYDSGSGNNNRQRSNTRKSTSRSPKNPSKPSGLQHTCAIDGETVTLRWNQSTLSQEVLETTQTAYAEKTSLLFSIPVAYASGAGGFDFSGLNDTSNGDDGDDGGNGGGGNNTSSSDNNDTITYELCVSTSGSNSHGQSNRNYNNCNVYSNSDMNETSWTGGVTPGEATHWRVRACNDRHCSSWSYPNPRSFTCTAPETECSDGIDNEGDGHIDYPDDPQCESATDDSEGNLVTVILEARDTTKNGNWTGGTLQIHPGNDVALTWDSENATSCSATSNPAGGGFSTGGAVDGTDTDIVEPTSGSSTTYIVICEDDEGSSGSDSVIVTAGASSGASLSARPAYVRAGQETELTWNVNQNDPAGCSITGPNVNIDALSSQQDSVEVTVNGESTYTIECASGDTDTATVRILPTVQET